jgi:hypothetical protein
VTTMLRGRRPAITAVGQVLWNPDGTITIAGWHLDLCAAGCPCHHHPLTGQLELLPDDTTGALGLVSHFAGGCDCCAPWAPAELAQIVADLADIAALQHTL